MTNDEIIRLKAECFDIDNQMNYLNEEKKKRIIKLQDLIQKSNIEQKTNKEIIKEEEIFKEEGEK